MSNKHISSILYPWEQDTIAEYAQTELSLMRRISDVLNTCDKCKGFQFVEGDICDCLRSRKIIFELICSRIPLRYWGTHADIFSDQINNGMTIQIQAPSNAGKTVWLSSLIKRELFKFGRKTVYFTADDLLNDFRQGKSDKLDETNLLLLDRLDSAEFVVVDDLDTFWATNFSVMYIEKILRNIQDSGKVLIIATKSPVCSGMHARLNTIISRADLQLEINCSFSGISRVDLLTTNGIFELSGEIHGRYGIS